MYSESAYAWLLSNPDGYVWVPLEAIAERNVTVLSLAEHTPSAARNREAQTPPGTPQQLTFRLFRA